MRTCNPNPPFGYLVSTGCAVDRGPWGTSTGAAVLTPFLCVCTFPTEPEPGGICSRTRSPNPSSSFSSSHEADFLGASQFPSLLTLPLARVTLTDSPPTHTQGGLAGGKCGLQRYHAPNLPSITASRLLPCVCGSVFCTNTDFVTSVLATCLIAVTSKNCWDS